MIALQLVDGHFQVQLAHAAQDQLAGLRIGARPQRRIVADHLAQGLGQLGLIDVLGRDDRLGDDRLGEADLFQGDRLVLVAERVAGRRLLQADDGDDLAGAGHFQPVAAVAEQPVNVADAFGLA